VEDRTGSGLWIELVESRAHPDPADIQSYSRQADELIDRPGVSSAWWGENSNPGRTDLPRKIEEFATLALYEVADSFSPPTTPQGSTGLYFHRTSRPGQGIITGMPTTGVLLVLISPKTPDGRKALRDWADFVHIRHIAEVAVPGYTMITPYENVAEGDPRFLHLYEMNSSDPESTFASMRPLVEKRLGSRGTAPFDAWAWHKELRIVYVNTFARLGSIPYRATIPDDALDA
jgi:hypothetical protein